MSALRDFDLADACAVGAGLRRAETLVEKTDYVLTLLAAQRATFKTMVRANRQEPVVGDASEEVRESGWDAALSAVEDELDDYDALPLVPVVRKERTS